MSVTKEVLEEIARLDCIATPAPWEWASFRKHNGDRTISLQRNGNRVADFTSDENAGDDALLCDVLRNNARAILDTIASLTKERDALRAVVAALIAEAQERKP